MPFAITQTCCSDATCVAVCPVNCIHPTPDEPDFGTAEMLYVDPKSCIDCGACADACPVDAIFPIERLSPSQQVYAEINAAYFDTIDPLVPASDSAPNFHQWGEPTFDRSLPSDFKPLRVAIVGTGPAGMYAAEDLLLHTPSHVTLIDRLPVAGGLVRYGVAPDHPSTKKVGEVLGRFHDHHRVTLRLGVEVGRDVTHEELAAHHDAVIYAVGASSDRRLELPGEDLPGVVSATRFVAWYNAHPEVPADAVDLSAERVVVVGNGNVAVDVARILVADPSDLAGTDIAEHALEALRASKVREVVLLGRRGPGEASYSSSELLALKHLPGVELVVDDHDPSVAAAIESGVGKAGLLRDVVRREVDWSAPPASDGPRRIVLRFNSAPVGFDGDVELRGVRVTGPSGEVEIPAGLALRAIGYRGVPVPGLPFDETTATVPHDRGRVAGRPGTYVVGWIKRGPSGGIGANRSCAEETVGALLEDAVAGALPTPAGSPAAFGRLARRRVRRVVDARGLAAIDRAEISRGPTCGSVPGQASHGPRAAQRLAAPAGSAALTSARGRVGRGGSGRRTAVSWDHELGPDGSARWRRAWRAGRPQPTTIVHQLAGSDLTSDRDVICAHMYDRDVRLAVRRGVRRRGRQPRLPVADRKRGRSVWPRLPMIACQRLIDDRSSAICRRGWLFVRSVPGWVLSTRPRWTPRVFRWPRNSPPPRSDIGRPDGNPVRFASDSGPPASPRRTNQAHPRCAVPRTDL